MMKVGRYGGCVRRHLYVHRLRQGTRFRHSWGVPAVVDLSSQSGASSFDMLALRPPFPSEPTSTCHQ